MTHRAKREGERRPFLSISDAEWKTLCNMKKTWAWIMKHFSQPKWCGYPDALQGQMGCWSLVGRMVTGRKYCKTCDCYIKKAALAKASKGRPRSG